MLILEVHTKLGLKASNPQQIGQLFVAELDMFLWHTLARLHLLSIPIQLQLQHKVIVRKVARDSEELYKSDIDTSCFLLHSIENPPPVVIVAFYLLYRSTPARWEMSLSTILWALSIKIMQDRALLIRSISALSAVSLGLFSCSVLRFISHFAGVVL